MSGEILVLGFIALLGALILIGRRVRKDAGPAKATSNNSPTSKGSLGRYSAEQWKRVLPEDPSAAIWIPSKAAGPVTQSKLTEIARHISKALSVFYKGGRPEDVEHYLIAAGALIPLPAGDGDPDYISYGEDQRPFMRKIIAEIRDILKMVETGDKSDHRMAILAALPEDIRSISHSESLEDDWLERVVAGFRNDPRVFDLEYNSGYPYTTGESSGNSDTLRQEGATEVGVFNMKCLAGDYADVMSRMVSLLTPPADKARFSLVQSGNQYGDGSSGTFSGIAARLRADERAFDVEVSTGRSYEGPEGTDDNHTAYEDIHETHYLDFSCRKSHAAELSKLIEELVADINPKVSWTVSN